MLASVRTPFSTILISLSVSSSCSHSALSSSRAWVPLGSSWTLMLASVRTPFSTILISLSVSSSCSHSALSSSRAWVPLGSSWTLTLASVRTPCSIILNSFPVPSSCSRSALCSSRVISTAPLSLKVLAIDGISILPVCSCWFSTFLSANPRISPCSWLRGNSKARQQENDHFGSLRHSFT